MFFFSRFRSFLLLPVVATGHVCSNLTPPMDPRCTTQTSIIQPVSISQSVLHSAVAEKFRPNAKIVGNCIFHILQGITNVPLSNVCFVLRDISALLDPSWGLVIAHFKSFSVEAIERRKGERRHGREA